MNGAKRVLVVDDEPDIRSSLAALLPLIIRGVSVETASDGDEALARLRAGERYDLIVSDQRMPRINGLELLAEAQRIVPGTPCILFTAYDYDLDEARDQLGEWHTTVMPKATDVDVMHDIISQALQDNSSVASA